MRIDIVTAHPRLLDSFFSYSMIKRAQDKGLLTLLVHNLRDFSKDKHKKVDDYPYGGGPGMVLQVEPFALCIEKLKGERPYDEIIMMSPSGDLLDQPLANALSLHENVMILCGHYKGIDERVRELYVTRELSIGNYVLTGGELAAAVFTDCIVRLLPGVLGDETSALTDSFQDGLLSPPVYTRPTEFAGLSVPAILVSGAHEEIQKWEHEKALEITARRRPSLLK